MWETRLRGSRNRLFFEPSWAQLASPPSLHIPKSSSNTSSCRLSPPGWKEHGVGHPLPGLTAWKGCSSHPGVTGDMAECIRLQLDPDGLLKSCFAVWTKGWPCMRCWKPWKRQEFHLCPTPLTTASLLELQQFEGEWSLGFWGGPSGFRKKNIWNYFPNQVSVPFMFKHCLK